MTWLNHGQETDCLNADYSKVPFNAITRIKRYLCQYRVIVLEILSWYRLVKQIGIVALPATLPPFFIFTREIDNTMGKSSSILSLPVTVLVVIAALDAADKALLGASFPMLERTLHLHGEYCFCL